VSRSIGRAETSTARVTSRFSDLAVNLGKKRVEKWKRRSKWREDEPDGVRQEVNEDLGETGCEKRERTGREMVIVSTGREEQTRKEKSRETRTNRDRRRLEREDQGGRGKIR
jgi:hypothetical protein